MEARMRHDCPETNNWSSVNEKTCSGLREILEHCRLPSRLKAREHWYIPECDAVVRCVFEYIESGQPLPSQQLFEAKSKPIPYQISSSAGEGRKDIPYTSESFSAQGNANRTIKTFICSHDRADNATMTQNLVSKKATSGSRPQSSPAVDPAVVVRSRPMDAPDADYSENNQTRKRAPSLKRSLSNLALRPSSSKSPAVQTMALPPVPPLPCDAKASNADKAGAGVHHDGGWPAPTFLDPIPQHRPMSGVEYGWSWPEGS
jgi:hypothetical protein